MGNTTDKPDFVGIVGHGTGEVYISLPIYLGDRPGRRMYSELVGSLEGKRLAGMPDAISEANKHFCRTTLKSHGRESIKKSTLCENILLNWKCRRKWTFIVYHFKEMVLSSVSLRDSSSMTFFTPRPKHPGWWSWSLCIFFQVTAKQKSPASGNISERLYWFFAYTCLFFHSTLISIFIFFLVNLLYLNK